MERNSTNTEESVTVNVELNGKYDEVMDILGKDEVKYEQLEHVLAELQIILDTVVSLDGGTKSRIHSNLPDRIASTLDTDGLLSILRTLEAYDLVGLDGNTWVPGPAITTE